MSHEEEERDEEAGAVAEVVPTDAIALSVAVTVQCLGCGELLLIEIHNEDPTQENYILEGAQACPTCSKRTGKQVAVDVAVLVGSQLIALDALDADEDDLGEQEAEGAGEDSEDDDQAGEEDDSGEEP